MCSTDLPIEPPTCLPQDNQRLGSPTLLRPPFAIRHVEVSSPEGSPLVRHLRWDVFTVVQEYQPVVHRLRLSASP